MAVILLCPYVIQRKLHPSPASSKRQSHTWGLHHYEHFASLRLHLQILIHPIGIRVSISVSRGGHTLGFTEEKRMDFLVFPIKPHLYSAPSGRDKLPWLPSYGSPYLRDRPQGADYGYGTANTDGQNGMVQQPKNYRPVILKPQHSSKLPGVSITTYTAGPCSQSFWF